MKTRTCTLLEKQLKAASTAIAALHHANCALRDEIGRQQGTNIIALDGRRTRSDNRPLE
ncbi:hypothetical protein ABZ137_21630 [Streptomyces bobili]|uniref:hypothetical protein n=1 Tax=Streptomyces bobili TaxID=67280 RepID=UPI0033ADE539